jgi:hypothetical protein
MGFFKNMIKDTINQKKAQGQILQLKKQYLRNWILPTLQDLCHSKGILTVEQTTNPGLNQQTVTTNPISFYKLVDIVAVTINSQEIIFFAKQRGLVFQDFERKVSELKSFYGLN